MTAPKCALIGAGYGAIAWSVYGLAEYVLAPLGPVIFQSDVVIDPWQWRWILITSLIYLLIGTLMGALIGIAWWGISRRRTAPSDAHTEKLIQATALAGIIVSFAANLARRGALTPPESATIVISTILAAALFWSTRSGVPPRWAGALLNPWLTSILLVGTPWIDGGLSRIQSTALGLAVLLVFAAGVFLAVLATRLPGTRNSSGGFPGLRRKLIVLACQAALLFATGLFCNRSMPLKAAFSKAPQPAGRRPNIVLVSMDTVGAEHLSVYGYNRDTTPYLAQFAKHATLYTRAIASSDMTLATHASIFTGLYPTWHGAHYLPNTRSAGQPLNAKFPTLAATLADNGYVTLAVVANKAYLGPDFGLLRGFGLQYLRTPSALLGPRQRHLLRTLVRDTLARFTSAREFDLGDRRAEDVDRDAFRALERAKSGGKPFFLFLNYMDAHQPYIPPPPFNTRFPGNDPTYTTARSQAAILAVMDRAHPLTAAEHAYLVSQYDGAIAYLDSQIGTLLDRLQQLGLDQNTMIILTGDHGESLGERNIIGHGFSLYQTEVAVPLIIRFPESHAPRTVDTLVSQVDLMPTILDVAGCPIPTLQGISLRRLPAQSPRSVYSERFPISWNRRFNQSQRAIVSADWKLITSTTGGAEVYNLRQDPGEARNLLAGGPDSFPQLQAGLRDWFKDAPLSPSRPANRPTPKTLERLKSLGYVQ